LLAQRRAKIAQKFVSGEWSAEFTDFEASQDADRKKSQLRSEQWRD
jgi:hypothetical protein